MSGIGTFSENYICFSNHAWKNHTNLRFKRNRANEGKKKTPKTEPPKSTLWEAGIEERAEWKPLRAVSDSRHGEFPTLYRYQLQPDPGRRLKSEQQNQGL